MNTCSKISLSEMAAPQQSRDTIKVDTIYERELDPTLAKQALSAVSQKNAAAKIDVAVGRLSLAL
jgi:hypothetical protein